LKLTNVLRLTVSILVIVAGAPAYARSIGYDTFERNALEDAICCAISSNAGDFYGTVDMEIRSASPNPQSGMFAPLEDTHAPEPPPESEHPHHVVLAGGVLYAVASRLRPK
jgi:hypothetical protein